MSVKTQKETARTPEGDPDDSTAVPRDGDDELDQKLAELRDNVSHSRVPEARAMIGELEARWPESKQVQYWARVLAPPVVVPTTGPDHRSRPRDRERAWLRAHGHEYPGCWLAVYGDDLIAADPDLGIVYSEARRVLGAEGALLHWQPGEPRPEVTQEYTGKRPYNTDSDTATGRLLVSVVCFVEQIVDPVDALLDTASEWCVLPPFMAALLGLDSRDAEETTVLSTRFGTLSGHLARVPVTFEATEGEPLALQTTCFFSNEWPGPMVIGWRGCLERMRFGFDTTEEAFYFAAG